MTEPACDQARFAAREFVARFERELGCELPATARDYVLFAYEMGYLRGRADAAEATIKMMGGAQ